MGEWWGAPTRAWVELYARDPFTQDTLMDWVGRRTGARFDTPPLDLEP